MSDYKITKEDIYAATEGGKAVILSIYPQSAAGFSGRRNFRIREGDDRKPSCTVFQKDGVWFLQDKGGTDTKAYTAVELVRKEYNLNYPQALEWIASKFAPDLLQGKDVRDASVPKPEMARMPGQDSMTVQLRPDGKFTKGELDLLGRGITQELCEHFDLKPVTSYITARTAKGDSWKITATPEYPVYYYDYGDYGKIYCPLGDIRFYWKDNKTVQEADDKAAADAKAQGLPAPKRRFIPFSGEKDFMARYRAVVNKEWNPQRTVPSEDGEGTVQEDMTWDKLIICSGPSDALNVRRSSPDYHVCWPNSETADITPEQYGILSQLAKKIYLLFDADDTGVKQAQKNALSYLDIAVIQLPSDLSSFRTRRGKPCKDAKDFFVHYRHPELGSVDDIFANMVKMAGSLKFWQEKRDKTNTLTGYDINNSQMYAFLQAMGFFTIDDPGHPRGYCHVHDNVVEMIPPEDIKARCMAQLQEFLVQHPQYYKQALANSIFRSKQVSPDSFSNLKKIRPNFDAYTADADYFFFRNGVFKVTADDIEHLKPGSCPYMVHSDKIIDHDFKVEASFFEIRRTPEYEGALSLLRRCTPRTPEYIEQKKQVDAIKDIRQYELEILRPDFDWLQFVYNTGRVYWQEENAGYILSEDQRAEHDLNFISKVTLLGYMLSKHKDAAKPYAAYAMETEQGEVGEHRGGTGKSILLGSVERLRRQNYIDGRHIKTDKMDFILQGVKKGYTDTVYIDDINHRVDMHIFMNWITGKMEVNAKYADKVTLSFKDSPKLALSSNHAITDFDGSLRRRIWFAAFSNYYHSEDPEQGMKAYTPDMDFHRTLIDDYSTEEMNHFYNFMLQCVQVWKKFRVRIQPAMRAIEMRNLKKAMTQEFLYWAESYFTDDKLNQVLETSTVFEEYKKDLPKPIAEMMKIQTFKKRLQQFCLYKDWVFNPKCLLKSKTEQERCDIRRKIAGKDRYYFFIDTTKNPDLPVSVILAEIDNPSGGEGVSATPGTLEGMAPEPWEQEGDAPAAAAAPQGEPKPIFG